MTQSALDKPSLGQRANKYYDEILRGTVETEENIGKMLILDVDSGDYEIDDEGIDSSDRLRARRPNGDLFGIRIGYKTAEVIGGVLERRPR